MKYLRTFLIALSVLLPAYAFSADLGIARVTLIYGDVQIFTDESNQWSAASINMPLKEGDRLWVPDGGRLEIHLRGGTYIRLDENTSLDILVLQKESAQFYLNSGHIYINNKRGAIGYIQVDTPLSSISSYENSIAMVDVSDRGYTEVSVLRGYVYAESRSGKTRVNAGRTLYVGEEMYAELSPLERPDEWEKWNRERDRELSRPSESARYLPYELIEYAYDFDVNGRWVFIMDYGYVWVPQAGVSIDWVPYRHGRWVWIGGDYVWISYEAWGWVPYHYGRWVYVSGIGWCWVPPAYGAVYWGPGYVAWIYTTTYVAWIPLAPGEIYYGHAYHGPGSVSIKDIDVHKVIIKQKYKNVHVKNAVTTIHREKFLRGKDIDFRVKYNPFLKEKVSIGPPDIKPERLTTVPVIKKIVEGKKPPERVKTIKPVEIKKQRGLVRTGESSVFRPEVPIKEMPLRQLPQPAKKIKRQPYSVPQR